MASEDKKKYNVMEPVLNNIIKEFISLEEKDIKRNNKLLHEIIQFLIEKMKMTDNLFNELYSSVYFGGSYYDGLKVCKPNEYDIDILLRLPKLLGPAIVTSNKPGFIFVKCETLEDFKRQPALVSRYRGLEKFINNKGYLTKSEILSWFESVIFRTFNEFENELNTSFGDINMKVIKGGPAFTLIVSGYLNGQEIKLDIDLVPCFEFAKDKWPKNGFRPNPISSKPYFFIVPKPLNDLSNGGIYWRLSFQQQEKELIAGKEKLKPTVKLLKKMRDTHNHNIASYFLKTIILWQVTERDEDFWNNSLSYVFMTILKEYHSYLARGKIPYYWYSKNDLIQNLNTDAKANLCNRIKRIIDDIERHLNDDKFVVAKYLLTSSELKRLKMLMSDQPEIIEESSDEYWEEC